MRASRIPAQSEVSDGGLRTTRSRRTTVAIDADTSALQQQLAEPRRLGRQFSNYARHRVRRHRRQGQGPQRRAALAGAEPVAAGAEGGTAAADQLVGGALAGLLGGGLGFAKGGVLQQRLPVPFASGGVIASPVTFPLADGRTGLAGERGAEAIMPLARGPDGRLGVAAQGGGGGVSRDVQRDDAGRRKLPPLARARWRPWWRARWRSASGICESVEPMIFHEVRFPTEISRGAQGGPERRTDVVVLGLGLRGAQRRWADSRRTYNAGYGVKSLDDLYAVIAFFEERRGRLYGFRWRDHADLQVVRAGRRCRRRSISRSASATGRRRRSSSSRPTAAPTRPGRATIKKPVAGTVRVAVDGVEQSGGEALHRRCGDRHRDVSAGARAGRRRRRHRRASSSTCRCASIPTSSRSTCRACATARSRTFPSSRCACEAAFRRAASASRQRRHDAVLVLAADAPRRRRARLHRSRPRPHLRRHDVRGRGRLHGERDARLRRPERRQPGGDERAHRRSASREADLARGLYDDARVEIFRVNWAAPEQRVLMRSGSLGEVRRAGLTFTAEVRGLAHYLQQPKGRLYPVHVRRRPRRSALHGRSRRGRPIAAKARSSRSRASGASLRAGSTPSPTTGSRAGC